MIEPTCTFKWEASNDPEDSTGVARFTVDGQSVVIEMDSFIQAARLNSLIQKACDLSRQQTIDRAIKDISNLLQTHRYD